MPDISSVVGSLVGCRVAGGQGPCRPRHSEDDGLLLTMAPRANSAACDHGYRANPDVH